MIKHSDVKSCFFNKKGIFLPHINLNKCVVMGIIVKLANIMAKRKITLGELAERINITPANLSNLKTGKGKAIRFSTLEAICHELRCQPGDILAFDEK